MSGLYDRILNYIAEKFLSPAANLINMKTQSVVVPVSCGANTYGSGSGSGKNAGWYPIGVVGYAITGGSSGSVALNRIYISSRSVGSVNVLAGVRNVSNAALSLEVKVDVLWVKVG